MTDLERGRLMVELMETVPVGAKLYTIDRPAQQKSGPCLDLFVIINQGQVPVGEQVAVLLEQPYCPDCRGIDMQALPFQDAVALVQAVAWLLYDDREALVPMLA